MAKNYKYQTKMPRVFSLGRVFPALKEKGLEFTNKEGKVIFGLDMEGTLFIRENFNFDGATPKFRLGFLTFGAWDGEWDEEVGEPQLYIPTMKHDALTQILYFCKENGIDLGLSYKDVDQIFKDDMIKVNFKYTNLYYSMVRVYDFVGRPRFLL